MSTSTSSSFSTSCLKLAWAQFYPALKAELCIWDSWDYQNAFQSKSVSSMSARKRDMNKFRLRAMRGKKSKQERETLSIPLGHTALGESCLPRRFPLFIKSPHPVGQRSWAGPTNLLFSPPSILCRLSAGQCCKTLSLSLPTTLLSQVKNTTLIDI